MEYYVFFFFQEEDGIRDSSVTGVQTCALPISVAIDAYREAVRVCPDDASLRQRLGLPLRRRPRYGGAVAAFREAGSGEGRGGERGRSRGWPVSLKKKKKRSSRRKLGQQKETST